MIVRRYGAARALYLSGCKCPPPVNPVMDAFLLDQLSVAPFGAYSIRRLRENYGGPCLRVRRTSDNTELDIGFNQFNYIDILQMQTFSPVANLRVVTWYDQSTNANHVTQGTANNQGRIGLIAGPNWHVGLLPQQSATGNCIMATVGAVAHGIGAGDFDVFCSYFHEQTNVFQNIVGIGNQTPQFSNRIAGNNRISYRLLGVTPGTVSFNPVNVLKGYTANWHRVSGTILCNINGVDSVSTFGSAGNIPADFINVFGLTPTGLQPTRAGVSEIIMFAGMTYPERVFTQVNCFQFYGLY